MDNHLEEEIKLLKDLNIDLLTIISNMQSEIEILHTMLDKVNKKVDLVYDKRN